MSSQTKKRITGFAPYGFGVPNLYALANGNSVPSIRLRNTTVLSDGTAGGVGRPSRFGRTYAEKTSKSPASYTVSVLYVPMGRGQGMRSCGSRSAAISSARFRIHDAASSIFALKPATASAFVSAYVLAATVTALDHMSFPVLLYGTKYLGRDDGLFPGGGTAVSNSVNFPRTGSENTYRPLLLVWSVNAKAQTSSPALKRRSTASRVEYSMGFSPPFRIFFSMW